MRRIADADAREWEVTIGRGSWGAYTAIFVPLKGGEVRETPLPAAGVEEASRSVMEAPIEELLTLLGKSGPRTH